MSEQKFRVGFSGDFFREDGSPGFPDADWSLLESDPRIETVVLPNGPSIEAKDTEHLDALMLLLPRIDEASFHPNKRLSVIARFGVGYDTVDLDAATDNDCALVIGPDGVRRPVAVSIMTLMLALTTRLLDKDRITRQGEKGWAQKTLLNGTGLSGLTLGSIGVGNIGAEMFRLAAPFDMQHIAFDPNVDATPVSVESVALDELFVRSDVLAVNCPLSETTKGLVNAERLAMMKPTAYLINTARGPIVDEAALIDALKTKSIAGAGLDVFEIEPTPADNPLFALDNVIVSPHALCFTDELFRGLSKADSEAALAVLNGVEPQNVVNKAVLSKTSFEEKLTRTKLRHALTQPTK